MTLAVFCVGTALTTLGYLAAAGVYALENNIERLALDHRHAQQIVVALKEKDFIGDMYPVETNIIIFEVTGKYSAQSLTEKLKENNILTMAISATQIRMVLHLDVSEEMVKETISVIAGL